MIVTWQELIKKRACGFSFFFFQENTYGCDIRKVSLSICFSRLWRQFYCYWSIFLRSPSLSGTSRIALANLVWISIILNKNIYIFKIIRFVYFLFEKLKKIFANYSQGQSNRKISIFVKPPNRPVRFIFYIFRATLQVIWFLKGS